MGIIEQCWLYTGYLNRKGYGQTNGRYVHRLTYEAIIGSIPEGLVIDHLCRVRHCYNPFHMEPVTNEENTRRRTYEWESLKTHCANGHEFNEVNTHVTARGHRICRACDRERQRIERETGKRKLDPFSHQYVWSY